MLPDGVLSTQSISGTILKPRNVPKELLIDYDYGPIAISDPSEGLQVKVWTGQYKSGGVYYRANDVVEQLVYSTPNVEELSITFDQNGRPCFGFGDNTGANIYWFNTVNNQYEVLNAGALSYNPRVVLDDKRQLELGVDDILFCYLISGKLCVRYQRERFQTEHVLDTVGVYAWLDQVGMNEKNRVQFNLRVAV